MPKKIIPFKGNNKFQVKHIPLSVFNLTFVRNHIYPHFFLLGQGVFPVSIFFLLKFLNEKKVQGMNEKEQFVAIRRQKKIRLKQIANYLNCSISLLSRYERDDCFMDEQKIIGYKNFIINYIKE